MRAPEFLYTLKNMQHTPQIKLAIEFAAQKHNGHQRLGARPLPYITHLFSVALLVAEDGAHDDTVTAALLHDTLEDTDTEYEELRDTFNPRVAELVSEVSEEKTLPWAERKADYLARLAHVSDEALLIALADKIDNIESKLEGVAREGHAMFARWPHPPEAYAQIDAATLSIALERLPTHRLTKRLAELCERERIVLCR